MNNEILLTNGVTTTTVACIPAIASNSGDSYIIVDDGCYVCVVPYQPGTSTVLYRPTTHLFQAAVDVLKTLPPLPTK